MKTLAMVRKLARLSQRSMAAKDYPAVNLCLALLAEIGTKKAAKRLTRKIHIGHQYIGGLPRTRCGVYADRHSVTTLPKEATCKRCKEVK